jgi:hypothetical protein
MITIRDIDCWPSRGAAKLLGIGRNTMLKKLRERGILSSDNLPTKPEYKDYFIVDRTHKHGFPVVITYITVAGLDFLKEELKDVPRKPEKPYKDQILSEELIAILNN